MKAALRLITLLLLVMAVTSISPAQKGDAHTRARGLFVNKKSDAIRILILKKEGTEGEVYAPVSPNYVFKTGDEIKARFESNFDGYVYVINLQPSGKRCLVFPFASGASNKIKAADPQELPQGASWQFDPESGSEDLQFILSREPIPYLDAAWRNPHCADLTKCCEIGLESKEGGKQKTQPSGIQTGRLAKVLPGNEVSLVRSRNIVVAQGKDKNEEGSYVAISDSKGQGLNLKPGQAVVFEVRLKRQ
jgi:hypothetical protein